MAHPTRSPAPARPPLRPGDPAWKSVELAQRGRIVLDVSAADLEAAEAILGPFHDTTWHFRRALADARRSWDRLRAEYGTAALEAALTEAPRAVLALGNDPRGEPLAVLVTIDGRTYGLHRVAGTPLAPVQWRLSRLPPLEHGPYYACRLRDGSTQCDCAEWAYGEDDPDGRRRCKHLRALESLGWI